MSGNLVSDSGSGALRRDPSSGHLLRGVNDTLYCTFNGALYLTGILRFPGGTYQLSLRSVNTVLYIPGTIPADRPKTIWEYVYNYGRAYLQVYLWLGLYRVLLYTGASGHVVAHNWTAPTESVLGAYTEWDLMISTYGPYASGTKSTVTEVSVFE